MARKTVAVVASNRSNSLAEFLAAWTPPGWDEIVIVEDGPMRSFDLGSTACPAHHFSWAEIDGDLDVTDGMTFSRRDSAIKLYGFWVALRLGADFVVVLDDDCFPVGPPGDFVSTHLAALSPRPRWVPSIRGTPTRGLPYFDLGTIEGAVANMGLWREIADYDAPQTLALHRSGELSHAYEPALGNFLMHPQHYWPWCAMNIAFRREVAPLMYMPRMGDGSPYRRFDDIWSGIILQRCCRHLDLSLAAGEPHIRHARASNPLINLEKEAPGIRANEEFWKVVESAPLGAAMRTPMECAEAIAEHFSGAGRHLVDTANPTLSDFIAGEGVRLKAWCAMFRQAGWE
jgi:hypothetical protein